MVLEKCERRVLRPKRMPKPGWRHHQKRTRTNVAAYDAICPFDSTIVDVVLLLLLLLLRVGVQQEKYTSANRQYSSYSTSWTSSLPNSNASCARTAANDATYDATYDATNDANDADDAANDAAATAATINKYHDCE